MANNPYAPPTEERDDQRWERNEDVSYYDGERRSVAITVLIYFVTCGIYGPIWFMRRQKFLDSLDSEQKIGSLPVVALVFLIAGMALAIAAPDSGVERLPSLGGGVIMLIMSFRTAAILRNDFARTGRILGVSGAAVFFFGPMYLQHKLNQAADMSPTIEEDAPRPKKKRKKKAAEVQQETSAE